MLWLIGLAAIVVDVFNRLSVPVDVVIEYSSGGSTTTLSPLLHDEVPIPHGINSEPHAVVLNDKGIATLLQKFNITADGTAKALVKAIKGGILYFNKNHTHDQDIETLKDFHDPKLLHVVEHSHPVENHDHDDDRSDQKKDGSVYDYERLEQVHEIEHNMEHKAIQFLPMTPPNPNKKSRDQVLLSTTQLTFLRVPTKAPISKPKLLSKSGSFKDPALPDSEAMYRGKEPEPRGVDDDDDDDDDEDIHDKK